MLIQPTLDTLNQLKLHGMVAPDGRVVRSKITGPVEAAAGLGRELAAELLD